jgi:prepilin peptidase CpaA
MDYFITIFLSVLLIASAIIDLKTQKIPNLITLPGMLIALGYHSTLNGLDGLLFSAGGIGVGIGLLIIPYLLGGMGAGDAKLMGAIGGFIGVKAAFSAFLIIAAVGGVYALIILVIYRSNFGGFLKKQFDTLVNLILIKKYIPDIEESEKNRPKLCYGLSIALGTGIYIFLDTTGYGFLS